jgi:hypothetical protein
MLCKIGEKKNALVKDHHINIINNTPKWLLSTKEPFIPS